MSKNKKQEEVIEEGRRSRKEVLIAKKEAEQTRGIRIGVGIVAGLILAIIMIALVNELVISPNREVASVENDKISLKDFQNRVEYERIQRIVLLESQLKAFNGDVGIIQQFASQMITELLPSSNEAFGEGVINQMVDELLIKQAAAARGITVSDEAVDEAIGADFGYYGGGLPTPLPAATETVVPTPSVTPISTAVITDVVEVPILPEPTTGPTGTPLPTATPVTEAAFQQKFDEFFKDYEGYNVTEAQYRAGIRMGLLRDLVMSALVEEEALPTEAENANIFVVASSDKAKAEETASLIETDGFLPVWNEIRSLPADPEAPSTLVAGELLQQTKDDLSQGFGADVAAAAFDLDIDTPSAVITAVGQDGTEQYFIIMVSGREMMDLTEADLQAQKEEVLAAYLQDLRKTAVINSIWRGHVPTLPVLDAKFTAAATATPVVVEPQPEATAVP